MQRIEKEITPIRELLPPETEGALTTQEVTDAETGQQIYQDLYIVDGRQAGEDSTTVVLLPWSEYVARPDAQDRYRLMADRLQTRLVAIDNIGVGSNTSRLTTDMKRDLRAGAPAVISKLQVEALAEQAVFRADNLTVIGYSLGAAMTASLLEQFPENATVDNLVLWEAVGQQVQSLGRHAVNFALHGGDQNGAYLKENPDWVAGTNISGLLKQLLREPAGLLAYARVTAHGGVIDGLRQAHEKGVIDKTTKVSIFSGDKSKISPVAANDRLSELFMGMSHSLDLRQEIHRGETHAVINSFPRVAAVISELALRR